MNETTKNEQIDVQVEANSIGFRIQTSTRTHGENEWMELKNKTEWERERASERASVCKSVYSTRVKT